jgi:hypothetical protein
VARKCMQLASITWSTRASDRHVSIIKSAKLERSFELPCVWFGASKGSILLGSLDVCTEPRYWVLGHSLLEYFELGRLDVLGIRTRYPVLIFAWADWTIATSSWMTSPWHRHRSVLTWDQHLFPTSTASLSSPTPSTRPSYHYTDQASRH